MAWTCTLVFFVCLLTTHLTPGMFLIKCINEVSTEVNRQWQMIFGVTAIKLVTKYWKWGKSTHVYFCMLLSRLPGC